MAHWVQLKGGGVWLNADHLVTLEIEEVGSRWRIVATDVNGDEHDLGDYQQDGEASDVLDRLMTFSGERDDANVLYP